MNGSSTGIWNQQAGYGLINAINAINAIDVLRVLSTDPTNGSTVTVTPSAITVTFTKPVNFSTVESDDLVFTSAPSGVTVNVGTPIAVDDPTYPTIVKFPFSFSSPTHRLPRPTAPTRSSSPTPTPPRQSCPRMVRRWFPRARSPSRSPTSPHPRSPTPRSSRASSRSSSPRR